MKSSQILRAKFSVLTTLALLAPLSAQDFRVVDDATQPAQPSLSVKRFGDGMAVNANPGTAEPGLLVLIGGFELRTTSLGKGLPDILGQSQIVAFAFAPAERISLTAPWPQFPVYLQVVEVDFESLRISASGVQQAGDPVPN